ncbi:MAG: energy transducer TonB [Mucilaginibacter sp.]
MKIFYSTIIALLLFTGAYAQENIKIDTAAAIQLKAFLQRRVLPIAVAVENNMQGTTVVSFKIDSGQNITDVHVLRSLCPEFDAEVLREFKMYNKTIPLTPAVYTAGVGLVIENKKPSKKYQPLDISLYQNYLFGVNVIVNSDN